MKFPQHQATIDLLKGLSGIEIGAAAHNPFNVKAKNVAPLSNYDFYAKEQIDMCGEAAQIDIDGFAHAIPIDDDSVDFVLSSHVIEHLPDIGAALAEWDRVTKPGGYIVMIVPQPNALKSDAKRPISTLEQVLAGSGRVPGSPKSDKHYWVFTMKRMMQVIAHFQPSWELVGTEDPDKKVRNGFWLAYRTSGTPRRAVAERPIAIIIPTLDATAAEKTADLAVATAGCDTRVIVVSGEPRGFTKTVNEGIAQTYEDEDICILNDDITRFQQNWLLDMSLCLHKQDDFGIVGPGGKSGTAPSSHGRPGMRGFEECEQAPYWCVLLKREMVDAIGVLDERFIHYCSDNEYNIRAKKAGWKVLWLRSVYLEHQHHGSGIRKEWQKHDQAAFAELMK